MDQRFIDLYDEYTHAPLERRVFLTRLARLAGSVAATVALVPLLESNYARAAIVPADDQRLEISRITYPGTTGDVKAYMARPKGAAKLPAVIVVHENRGINPHIEDVARRVALESFLAMAPDLLSPLGGTPANEDAARAMYAKLDGKQAVQNLVSAVAFLKKHANGSGKVGAVGFCRGGTWVNEMAVNAPDLNAAVAYYGEQPRAPDVEKIRAPLLLHYAGLDERVNAGIPAFEEALKKTNKKYTLHLYEGTHHAFNNDTSEARYNKQAADQAWARTIAFFKANLKT